jgi:protein gp37
MNKSKIEWCTRTWNPITGCFHGCPYCYAEKIANRFGLAFAPRLGDPGMEGASKHDSDEGMDTMLELEKPYKSYEGKRSAYPMAFSPTFHRYRLGEPAKEKEPQNIFVGSMADVFGEWVPVEWQEEIFEACEAAPWHRYIFLTKNPDGYNRWYSYYDNRPNNFWFGASATNYNDMVSIRQTLAKSLNFLSLEPLHGYVDLGKFVRENPGQLDWVIVGAETGRRKERITPELDWVAEIIVTAKRKGIPLFMKNSLKKAWGEHFIQQYPWEVPA